MLLMYYDFICVNAVPGVENLLYDISARKAQSCIMVLVT